MLWWCCIWIVYVWFWCNNNCLRFWDLFFIRYILVHGNLYCWVKELKRHKNKLALLRHSSTNFKLPLSYIIITHIEQVEFIKYGFVNRLTFCYNQTYTQRQRRSICVKYLHWWSWKQMVLYVNGHNTTKCIFILILIPLITHWLSPSC